MLSFFQSLFLFLHSFYPSLSKRPVAIVSLAMLAILVSISGVVVHPTYFIATIVSLACVTLSKMILGEKYKVPEFKGKELILNISVVTLSYWTYSEIIGCIVYPAKDFLASVLELFSKLELHRFRSTYFAVTTPPFLAYAWVISPALSGALLFSEFIRYIKYRNKKS